MRSGGFPGQRAALAARVEQVRLEEKRRATRRMFLGAAVGCAAGAVAGGWTAVALRRPAAVSGDRPEESDGAAASRPWTRAHELATGDLEELIRFRADFLIAVKQAPRPDDTMWLGVERLAAAAIDGPEATREPIRQLLAVLERGGTPLPGHARRWLELVRARRR